LISAYRLCKGKWKASNGAGAALHGGRWNPIRVEVVYTSSSAALCILERIVHFTAGILPGDDALTEIHIPATVQIEFVPDDRLPANWNALIDHPEPQAFGGQWVAEGRTCVLSVPSSILPRERNLILNPAHVDFGTIEFSSPQAFTFDPRLKK
jgi:RES domain-containing protein